MNDSRISALFFMAACFLSSISSAFGQDKLPDRYYSWQIDFDHVITNKILIKNVIGKEAPSRIAYRVMFNERDFNRSLTDVDAQRLNWKPYTPEMLVDLGSGIGSKWSRYVWIDVEWQNPTKYQSEDLWVTVEKESKLSSLIITYPTNKITSQPYLQVLGYINTERFKDFQCDLSNAAGKSTHDVFLYDKQGWDADKNDYAKCFFHAYDLELAPGTNSITLHCRLTGNYVSTNIEVIFSTVGDTNAPAITPFWPTNNMELSGSTFTARGNVDDYTASLKGIISGGGQTQDLTGLVERNGTYWVENIPVLAKTNLLTLTATDAAGNSSQVKLHLFKSEIELEIESTPTGEALYEPTGLVTGHVTPGYDVYVNGYKAVVKPDGRWRAEKTPIYGRGTATFDATAVPSEATWAAKNTTAGIKNLLTAVANLKDEPIVINASQSACGTFAIRLTGTYGKKFILMDSTNLMNWVPILTNLNSTPVFDYTDTNTANSPCRFFKVVPLP